MAYLTSFGPLLLSAGLLSAIMLLFGREAAAPRAISAAIAAALSLRYLWWRWTMSLPDPDEQTALQTAWTWCFLIAETMTFLTSVSLLLWMMRVRDRSADADALQDSPLWAAPTDVFITTYNESYDILERTIVAATCIDHPDLRVWVLDDGARDWMRALSKELGVLYVSRYKGQHAKAGNVNNGLKHALATGRPPEFLLLLDADFVADRSILRRTLGLFKEEDVGIVQTPQHFFNPDPFQTNLSCSNVWPDEQRFFFNYLLESKDAWGAAFCCGTSGVFRVKALEAAGGMATETVTEDMLTSFKLQEYGYRTIYLNEPLSMGLAPEGLKEYVSQRARWCLGAMQQIYTRWSFFGRARMSVANRLSFLDTTCYWGFTFLFKLMMVTTPAVYWWTGTSVVQATMGEIVYWLAPATAAYMMFLGFYTRNHIMPVMTDATQLLAAFAIVRTVATALVKPWGHAFKVTAKGVSTEKVVVQWSFFLPLVLLAVATLIGLAVNLSPYSAQNGTIGYSLNVAWSLLSAGLLFVAAAVCVEMPKRRQAERFTSNEPAMLTTADGSTMHCHITDISVNGALLAGVEGWHGGATGHLTFLDDGLSIPCKSVRAARDGLALQFDDRPFFRRQMIARLFTGAYRNEVEHVSTWRVLRSVTAALFA